MNKAIKLDRRKFLKAAGAGAAAISFSDSLQAFAHEGAGQPPALKPEVANVKALVFDTYGTVVDWRTSIIAEGVAFGRAKGLTNVDWAAFADALRGRARAATQTALVENTPWVKLDDQIRAKLEVIFKEFKIEGLTPEEKENWARVYRRLKPWPDSVKGLTRLKKKYVIGPLSNGSIAQMTWLAKSAGLPWDVILGAELVHHFKPSREVYTSAYQFLDLKPEEVMLCAAHAYDLKAASGFGLRTGFIYRPNEWGDGHAGTPDKANPGDFDVVSTSIVDLARQLGA